MIAPTIRPYKSGSGCSGGVVITEGAESDGTSAISVSTSFGDGGVLGKLLILFCSRQVFFVRCAIYCAKKLILGCFFHQFVAVVMY